MEQTVSKFWLFGVCIFGGGWREATINGGCMHGVLGGCYPWNSAVHVHYDKKNSKERQFTKFMIYTL